jgi:hypothetical protein
MINGKLSYSKLTFFPKKNTQHISPILQITKELCTKTSMDHSTKESKFLSLRTTLQKIK